MSTQNTPFITPFPEFLFFYPGQAIQAPERCPSVPRSLHHTPVLFFLSGEWHFGVPLAQCDLRRPCGLRYRFVPGKLSALVRILGAVGGPGMPTSHRRAPVLPPECREGWAASQSRGSCHMLELKCLEGQYNCSFSLSFFSFLCHTSNNLMLNI